MTDDFDINDFKSTAIQNKGFRYEKRIKELKNEGFYTDSIENAVTGAIENIHKHKTRSFVIYGEPQSGKTGMMIALTAKLLDEGHKIIVILLNDSVQLLEQNLERFLRSGLDPAPKKFSEILDPSITIGNSNWVIFSKKNSGDLQKLLAKIGTIKDKVIIDDEADFATPNSKVNKQNEKTRINDLVGRLLGKDGVYIGVTATPARLDLNNTFENNNEKWIDFPPHPNYTGQDIFFPTTQEGFNFNFGLELLPESGDDPKYLREAFFGFLINASFLNLKINDSDENYSMLIHTSGMTADHTKDYQQVIKIFNVLKDDAHKKYESYVRRIYQIAQQRYPGLEKDITKYILAHIDQNDIVIMNSNTDKNTVDYKRATTPSTLFTIAIGGNIVSRGVTFDNLLCMFFTRDVKHKIQQDTYIQRARMFGSREEYLNYFELHIPEKLYFDWQKCFVFHRLALSFIRAGKGSPVWLEDRRVSAVASNSIDKATVALDSGEMSWDLFEYDSKLDQITDNVSQNSQETLRIVSEIVGENGFPPYVLQFIDEFSPYGDSSIAIHKTTTLGSDYASADTEKIIRTRGFISTGDLEKDRYPKAIHHIKIFRNQANKARVFYKYTPEIGNIRFIKNMRTNVTA
jgi:hypothetical protein